jgi:hypothetical protein
MQQYRRFGVSGVSIASHHQARAPPDVPAFRSQTRHSSPQSGDIATVPIDEEEALRPFAGRAAELQ